VTVEPVEGVLELVLDELDADVVKGLVLLDDVIELKLLGVRVNELCVVDDLAVVELFVEAVEAEAVLELVIELELLEAE